MGLLFRLWSFFYASGLSSVLFLSWIFNDSFIYSSLKVGNCIGGVIQFRKGVSPTCSDNIYETDGVFSCGLESDNILACTAWRYTMDDLNTELKGEEGEGGEGITVIIFYINPSK